MVRRATGFDAPHGLADCRHDIAVEVARSGSCRLTSKTLTPTGAVGRTQVKLLKFTASAQLSTAGRGSRNPGGNPLPLKQAHYS
jgi:hypothetical protein